VKNVRAVQIGLTLASVLWAGREFPTKPGERTVPNQLLVRYKSGVTLASAATSLARGAQMRDLRDSLSFLVTLPAGTAATVSQQLSAHPLVDYVEPNRAPGTDPSAQSARKTKRQANQFSHGPTDIASRHRRQQ
jgi:hypothetical protein